MTEQFFLTVNSSAACEFSDSNSPSNFRVHLGRVLDLKGSWEIALFELFFPCTLCNVRGPSRYIIHEKTSLDLETGELGTRGDRGHAIIELEERFYSSEKDLIQELNNKLAPTLNFELDNSKKVKVYLNEMSQNGDISSFTFAEPLLAMLGIQGVNTLGCYTENGRYKYISANTPVAQSVMPVNVCIGLPNTLTVHTDLIANQIIDNSHARVLRVVETGARNYKQGFTKKVEFSKLLFIPLAKHKIEYVDLYIKDDFGLNASFLSGALSAVLVFRKVSHE
jgi:hypothetical protein